MNVNNNSNLGIVVECIENSFDENQSLLLNSSQQVKRKLSDRLIDSNKQDRNNLSSMTSTDSTTTSKCNNIDEDDTKQLNISNIKIKKKSQQQSQQQPSRLERSRLGLITFLNNITAAPTNSDLDNTSEELFRKNTRSHSITSSSANSNNIIKLPEQYKNINKSTKSLCTKLSIIEQQQNNQRETYEISLKQDEALSVCDVPLTTTINNNNKIENCGYGYKEDSDNTNNNTNNQGSGGSGGGHCDKLSIKSGISVAASSNSGPSESLFSGGSAHSNISGIKSCFKQKECPICCIRQPTQNFYRLKACTHIFCKACLVKYLGIEIAESRTDISCPECPICLQISDIYNLLSHQPEMLERFEFYSLRRVLSIDPDTRWCPAPDCTYAVIANSCAACPQLKCERCTTSFCYHCKSYWHPNQTCDQAKSKSFFNSPLVNNIRSSFPSNNSESSDEMKACPRCGALITKMNDGSCNHMQCALCNAEFCWLCLKQINELHYLSPTGCTFWGKKPWTRKKKLLWQIGTLIGAPLGIALIAGLAVPGIICGVPIFIGRKTYQRFSTLSRTKRQLATALSVVGSLIISPVLAVMTVGVGVPIMLAYVYGVVPLSLCRNGACGGGSGSGGGGNGSSTNDRNINSTFRDEEGAYGERILISDGGEKSKNNTSSIKTTKSSFHQRRQSIASFGLVSLTDKPNTEDASIQAIAGSQYNYDNRSVHTIWSNGQYGGHVIESVHGINIYNAEDAENAENASTMACCSASIAAQASERRSLTGSNSSFKTRPRSSISNSRGVSEEPGKIPTKFTRKISSKNIECGLISKEIGGGGGGRLEVLPIQSTSINDLPGTSTITNISVSQQQQKKKSRFSIRSFVRHPINTVIGKRKSFNAIDGGKD